MGSDVHGRAGAFETHLREVIPSAFADILLGYRLSFSGGKVNLLISVYSSRKSAKAHGLAWGVMYTVVPALLREVIPSASADILLGYRLTFSGGKVNLLISVYSSRKSA